MGGEEKWLGLWLGFGVIVGRYGLNHYQYYITNVLFKLGKSAEIFLRNRVPKFPQ
mgnify:CR=1 FL=1